MPLPAAEPAPVEGSEGAPPQEAPWPLTQWSEADLLAYCRRTARLCGFKVYHTRWSVGSDSGFPDLLLCRAADPTRGLPGRLILAELKRAGRPLTRGTVRYGRRLRWTEGQREWLTALLTCPGVEAYWWTTADVAEITEILQTGPRDVMACVVRSRSLLTEASDTGAEEAHAVP
jgi:hypothetical protein